MSPWTTCLLIRWLELFRLWFSPNLDYVDFTLQSSPYCYITCVCKFDDMNKRYVVNATVVFF